jgi:hypothetical protein
METISLFIFLSGYIVGLGAVTVIDLHGFFARRSSYWTEATIRTHKITKPLIWIGIFLVSIGYYSLYRLGWFASTEMWMTGLYAILIVNGLFLSFSVSPMLIDREKTGKGTEILPSRWQAAITASFILSVMGWWGTLILAVREIAYRTGIFF